MLAYRVTLDFLQQIRKEIGGMGMKEVEMIRHEARLSALFIWKNSDEIWFQLNGRLTKWGNAGVC